MQFHGSFFQTLANGSTSDSNNLTSISSSKSEDSGLGSSLTDVLADLLPSTSVSGGGFQFPDLESLRLVHYLIFQTILNLKSIIFDN